MPSATATQQRVVAVVVAWNRRELLGQCLDGLAAQTRPADAVIVVDNASTDDSGALARAHQVVDRVVTMPTNTGGAGGFTAGIATAVASLSASQVWIMDDDTVPTATALQELLRAGEHYDFDTAVLASRADWHDGREHPMNTPRTRLDASSAERRRAGTIGCRPIRSASFVSILINADAVRECGLPVADYFLWNDDFEYTARLLRSYEGLYVPASRVRHLTKVFGNAGADPGPRFYQEVRNKVWLFTRSGALKGWEKLVYGGSTLLRWARTLQRSGDRGLLFDGLRRGLRDGWRKAPRPNAEVLGATPAAEDIMAVARSVPGQGISGQRTSGQDASGKDTA